MDVPLQTTWWVQEGRLLAGCWPRPGAPQPTDDRLRTLLAAGVRVFVALQEAHDGGPAGAPVDYRLSLKALAAELQLDIHCHSITIPPGELPAPSTLRQVLDLIDTALAQEQCVFVHCSGVPGRIGTVIGCWLRRQGYDGEAAIAQLRRLRGYHPAMCSRSCLETVAQYEMVRRWEAG